MEVDSVSESQLSVSAREARAAYKREWARKNPGKNKEYVARYWERKARKQGEGSDDNATQNDDH